MSTGDHREGQVATIQDVARRAGVGVGTVSRVINDSPLVSEATRARVQSVIDELGYRPNRMARALSLGRTSSITVVAPFLTHPSVVVRLQGVASVIRESVFDLVLFDVETPEQRTERLAAALEAGRSAAVIVVSLAGEIDPRHHPGIPVVWLDRRVEGVPSVSIDDVAGGRMAAQHLLDLGHRRIAFVGDDPLPEFGFTSSDERLRGFTSALEAAGVGLAPELVRRAPHGRSEAHRVTDELLALPEPPTAVFAASDLQGFGVVEAARAAGLAVPGDLSVVGFDDIETAPYFGLTTVRQPLYESGVRGAELAVALLAGDDVPDTLQIELPLQLVERTTTGLPR